MMRKKCLQGMRVSNCGHCCVDIVLLFINNIIVFVFRSARPIDAIYSVVREMADPDAVRLGGKTLIHCLTLLPCVTHLGHASTCVCVCQCACVVLCACM